MNISNAGVTYWPNLCGDDTEYDAFWVSKPNECTVFDKFSLKYMYNLEWRHHVEHVYTGSDAVLSRHGRDVVLWWVSSFLRILPHSLLHPSTKEILLERKEYTKHPQNGMIQCTSLTMEVCYWKYMYFSCSPPDVSSAPAYVSQKSYKLFSTSATRLLQASLRHASSSSPP